MHTPRIRLLALDLDGTVLNDAKHITPATRAALEEAMAAGVTVVPASGRPLQGLSREFLDIPGVEYAISSNGAAIDRLSDGARLYSDALDHDLALELMERLGKLEVMATFFADGQGYVSRRQRRLLPRLPVTEPVRDYLRTSRAPVEDPIALLRHCSQVEKFSLNFLSDGQGGWQEGNRVQEILAQYPGLSVVSGGANNVEITSPTANKGRALLALARLLDIDRAETMACGDSENDLEMLKAAGLSVAMANSEACLFPWAQVVTASNEDDGVAQAIERHILGK